MSSQFQPAGAGPPSARASGESGVGAALPSRTWYWFDSGPGNAAFNMAVDEALLEIMPGLARPILRFYGWTEPAASFGYFQKYVDVARATKLRPLVRRPTAGGIVPHNADWTYSFAVPAGHEWYRLKAADSYRQMHEWIQRAFARLNVAAELAPHSRKGSRGQCFDGYEQFDLVWRERKIAGAAQRRTRLGLLIQGSVQPSPGGLSRLDWHAAMCAGAPLQGGEWIPFEPDTRFRARVAEIESGKYARAEYNRKR